MSILDSIAKGIFGRGGQPAPRVQAFNLDVFEKMAMGEPVERPNIGSSKYEKESKIQVPFYSKDMNDYYTARNACSVVATCQANLRGEILRRGGEWVAAYALRCEVCDKDYEDIPKDAEKTEAGDYLCPVCRTAMVESDPREYEYAERLFANCNENGQDIFAVLGELIDDWNTVDDAYLIKRQRYVIDDDGGIAERQLVELVSGDPRVMRLVADDTGRLGGKFWTCPAHRDVILEKTGRCPKCDLPLHDVHHVAMKTGSAGGRDLEIAFLKGEVLHRSIYFPSLMYGTPPMMTLWFETTSLIFMSRLIRMTWEKARIVKGIVAVKTMNIDSFQAQWDSEMEKMWNDPMHIPAIAVEPNGEKGGAGIEFVSFMPSMQEMEFIETRNELRERISSFYGVSNIFMGDTSTSGGLNNEGLQILVTNRSVERIQRIINEQIFPDILGSLGITGWKYRLRPSEEQDEMAELQQEQIRIMNAQAMQGMGFEVRRGENDEFDYSSEAKNPPQNAPGGGQDPTMFGQANTSPPNRGTRPFSGAPAAFGKADYTGARGRIAEAVEAEERLESGVRRAIEDALPDAKGLEGDALKAWIERTAADVYRELRDAAETELRGALDTGYSQAVRMAGDAGIRKADDMTPDQAFIDAISSAKLWDAFDGVEGALSARMSEVVKELLGSPGGFSYDEMVERMRELVDLESYRLERIARTESHAFVMRGRKLGFQRSDPDDTRLLYDWVGPDDRRTSDVCKAIKAAIRSEGKGLGVSLGRLTAIVSEKSRQFMGPGWGVRDLSPHPGCRHDAIVVGRRPMAKGDYGVKEGD